MDTEEIRDLELEPIDQKGFSLADICRKTTENFPQIPFSALALSVYGTGSILHQWDVLRISYTEPTQPKIIGQSKNFEIYLKPRLTLQDVVCAAARFQSFDPEKTYLCWDEKINFFLRQE